MDTIAALPTTPVALAVARPALGRCEVEHWLDEVAPVLLALRARVARPSSGQRRWMAEQAVLGTGAEALLCWAVLDGEEAGEPDAEAEWLLGRVSALVELVEALLHGEPTPVAA